MNARENVIKVVLNDDEAAVLDEKRGNTPRAVYLRQLVYAQAPAVEIATRAEALALLTRLARDGQQQSAIALAKELREGGAPDLTDWIMSADGG